MQTQCILLLMKGTACTKSPIFYHYLLPNFLLKLCMDLQKEQKFPTFCVPDYLRGLDSARSYNSPKWNHFDLISSLFLLMENYTEIIKVLNLPQAYPLNLITHPQKIEEI